MDLYSSPETLSNTWTKLVASKVIIRGGRGDGGQFGSKDHYLKTLGRGPLDDISYQISKP